MKVHWSFVYFEMKIAGKRKKKTSANSDGETVMYWYDTDMLTETGYFVSP